MGIKIVKEDFDYREPDGSIDLNLTVAQWGCYNGDETLTLRFDEISSDVSLFDISTHEIVEGSIGYVLHKMGICNCKDHFKEPEKLSECPYQIRHNYALCHFLTGMSLRPHVYESAFPSDGKIKIMKKLKFGRE